jgi:hypothetical protein
MTPRPISAEHSAITRTGKGQKIKTRPPTVEEEEGIEEGI